MLSSMAKRTLNLACCISFYFCAGFFDLTADTVSRPARRYGLGDVTAMVVSADHRYLATGGQGGAFLWDLQTGALLQRLETSWSVSALAFSPDGAVLLGASRSTIFAWSTGSGESVRSFLGHEGDITALQFHGDGETFISAGGDNTTRQWSMSTGGQLSQVTVPGSPILDAALSPDGGTVATADVFVTNGVKIWDLATQSMLRFLPRTNWNPNHVLFASPTRLITSGADRSVILWDVDSGEELRSFTGVTGLAVVIIDLWLPDASTLAAACNDGRVFLWDLETGSSLGVVPGSPVIAAAGVPGSARVVAAEGDYAVRLRALP
jgi:WD40 repeat protein